MATITQILLAGATSVTAPADASSVTFHMLGRGGTGQASTASTNQRKGGGGGAAYGVTFACSAGETINLSIPAGATSAATTLAFASGATRTASCDYGRNGATTNATAGGLSANNSQTGGTVVYSYSGGTSGSNNGGVGGGGAAGPDGAGKNGGNGGAGGAGGGGGSNGLSSTNGGNGFPPASRSNPSKSPSWMAWSPPIRS